jgi:RHS repeat-associated protein
LRPGKSPRCAPPAARSCGESHIVGVYNPGNELECRREAGVEGCPNEEKAGGIASYSYNGAGDETAITGYSKTEAESTTSFAYNNGNQLEGLTPFGKGEEKLQYLGSGQGKLVGLGATTLQNSSLGITKQTIEGNASYYARTPEGTLVDERLPGGESYNPVYDAQGDIVGLLNSSGELKQTVRYGPYGQNPKAEEVGEHAAKYNATDDPFLFQGGYHVSGGSTASGLYHFGERYYDPTTGRWTQQDPLGQAGSPEGDLYGFDGDDPANGSDSTGTRVLPSNSDNEPNGELQGECSAVDGPIFYHEDRAEDEEVCEHESTHFYSDELEGQGYSKTQASGERAIHAKMQNAEFELDNREMFK